MAINITSLLSEDELRLLGRIDELYSRADNGIVSFSGFLNMRECFIIENLRRVFFSDDESAPLCFFYGGYPDAERRIFFAIPAYARYSLPDGVFITNAFSDELSSAIVPLKIKTSGYVNLAHRDFLGALIGLGLERSALGDILIGDDGAIVFVNPSVAKLIKNELCYIGRDKVKISDITLPEDFSFSREFEKITGTVASARIDAVVSELARVSRENAKSLIDSGFVEHNHFTAVQHDRQVTNGDIISIRKSGTAKGGKFIVDSVDETSKKGRIRLIARRYI